MYARVLYRLDELEGLVVHVFVVVSLDIGDRSCVLLVFMKKKKGGFVIFE